MRKLGLIYSGANLNTKELKLYNEVFDEVLILNVENFLTVDDVRNIFYNVSKLPPVYLSYPKKGEDVRSLCALHGVDFAGYYFPKETPWSLEGLLNWRKINECKLWIPCQYKKWYEPHARNMAKVYSKKMKVFLQPNMYQERYHRTVDDLAKTFAWCKKNNINPQLEFDELIINNKFQRNKLDQQLGALERSNFDEVAVYSGAHGLWNLKCFFPELLGRLKDL